MAGSPEEVLGDLNNIIEAAESRGLSIRPDKCELYFAGTETPDIRAQFESLAPGITVLTQEDLTLLGAPITDLAADSILMSKLEELKLMGERLAEIDAHEALFLLRNCFAIPKLTYFLRTAPFFQHQSTLDSYDQEIRAILQKILNLTLHDEAWEQSSLPVSQGGLGIRKASDLALPAFLASAYGASAPMTKLLPQDLHEEEYKLQSQAECEWKEKFNNNQAVPAMKATQKAWDAPLYEAKYQQLLDDEEDPVERARLLAVASDHASDWLNAMPIASLGNKLDNQSLRIACGLRLGTRLCHPHTCKCGGQVDSSGRHGLYCRNAEGRHPRHSQVNDLIRSAMATAHIPTLKEPRGLSKDDEKRPDGLTLLPWSQGRSLCWDYTCSDTMAPSHVPQTSKEAGQAAIKADKKKEDHYADLATSGYIIMPVASETLGSWSPVGRKFIEEVGKRMAESTGEKRSTTFLFQSIGIAIQRGNAASVAGTVPRHKTLDELYYL